MNDRLAHRLEEWLRSIDDLFFAADHDRQPGLACADVAAGDRRIDGMHLLWPVPPDRSRSPVPARSSSCRPRRCPAWRRERAVGPQRHLADVAGIADDREDDVGLQRRPPGVNRRAWPPAPPAAALSPRCGCKLLPRSRPRSSGRTSIVPITPVPIQPMRVFPGANSSAIAGSPRLPLSQIVASRYNSEAVVAHYNDGSWAAHPIDPLAPVTSSPSPENGPSFSSRFLHIRAHLCRIP